MREDGHAQERSLLNQVVPLLEPSDLLIADRNFDMRAFLFGIKRSQSPLYHSRTWANGLEIAENPAIWAVP